MSSKKITLCLLATLFCLAVTSCAKVTPPGTYEASEVGKVRKVISGTILSIRPVNIRIKAAESTNANLATEAADNNNITRSRGLEFVIRLNSGSVISIVQTDAVDLKVKQRVLVIYGENTRVVADEGGDDY